MTRHLSQEECTELLRDAALVYAATGQPVFPVHPAGPEVVVKTGQRETRLLNVRVRDAAIETGGAGQEFNGEIQRVGAAVDQAANGDAGRRGQLPLR